MKKFLISLLLVIVAALLGGYILLFKPYMEFSYERIDSEPVILAVEYLNAVGDPLCTKLYVKDSGGKYRAIFPKFPADLEDLHNNEQLEFGETVQLSGYRSEWVAKNKITGSESRRDVGEIDVVAWRSVGVGEYSTKLTGLKPSDFHGDNYTACLWDDE